MRALPILILAGAVGTAHAQDFTKETYPQELARRPIVLPAGMVEFQAGAQFDGVGTREGVARSKLDLYYGIVDRLQLGLESDVAIVPSDAFAVTDTAAWMQYNLVPSWNLRGGFYMQIPREVDAVTMDSELGDAIFGFRIGSPMKFKSGKSAAVWLAPRMGRPLTGDGKQTSWEMPIGVQLQVVNSLAVSAWTAMQTRDFSFDDEDWEMPMAFGLVLAATRRFDLAGELRVNDVTESAGREDRWLLFWMAIRQ